MIRRILLSILLVAVLSLPTFASACACCVERGFYSLVSIKPGTAQLAMFESMKFAAPAEFYMSAAGFDGIRGLDVLEKDEAAGKSVALDVIGSFLNRTWTFSVKTGGGRSGTLTLPMPRTVRVFKADIDGVDNGLGVSLYKEFSAHGTVRNAAGIFSTAKRNTDYSLVFQGRGNGCDDAADFTRWRLELNGPKAKYAFFGTLN